jgi:hypothetical protein
MPWNVTLKCGHRYQVPEAPDLARPLICGMTSPGHTRADGLQMIVAAINALEEAVRDHNERLAAKRERDRRAARTRARAEAG